MNKIIMTAALCALALPALAQSKPQCPNYPPAERMGVHKIQRQLLNQGYVIREFDYERNCYEAKVMDKDGQRSKLYLDAKSGKVTESITKNNKDRKTRRESKQMQW